VRREQRALPARDARQDRHRIELARGAAHAQLAQDLLDHAQAVALIEDHEALAELERLLLFLREAQPEAVERAHPDLARERPADQRDHALDQLFGRLVGEADRQDAIGRDAAADQAGDALRDHARLAAARASEHEQGTIAVLHGSALCSIELGHAVRRVGWQPLRSQLPCQYARAASATRSTDR
jgi:hypothetical protein